MCFATSPYGKGRTAWGYDPRVTAIGDKYYITWCNDFHGPTIGLAWTTDFKKFHQMDNVFIPHNATASCLAFCQVDELIAYIKTHSAV